MIFTDTDIAKWERLEKEHRMLLEIIGEVTMRTTEFPSIVSLKAILKEVDAAKTKFLLARARELEPPK